MQPRPHLGFWFPRDSSRAAAGHGREHWHVDGPRIGPRARTFRTRGSSLGRGARTRGRLANKPKSPRTLQPEGCVERKKNARRLAAAARDGGARRGKVWWWRGHLPRDRRGGGRRRAAGGDLRRRRRG